MNSWLESFLTPGSHRATLMTDSAYIFETEASRSLHFNSRWVQSMMRRDAPDALALAYTQMMMGFLLFNPAPDRVALIGLGGGSLAKYCLKHLPEISLVAVENSKDVLSLRSHFCIPPDNRKFHVVHADGADFIQRRHQPKFDVIMLDAFDADGLPPTLCSQGFYDHCYARLQDGGVLVANFPDDDGKFGTFAARIRESFDEQVVSIEATEDGNKILYALKGGSFPPPSALLHARATALNKTHTVNFLTAATKISGRLQKRPLSALNRLITGWPTIDLRSSIKKSSGPKRRNANDA